MKEIVERLERAGVHLKADGDTVRLVPKSRLTPELLEMARRHKQELIAYVKARDLAAWCQQFHVDLAVATEIARVEDEALAAGWPVERLWGIKFWLGEERGLVLMLDPGDQIFEVTAEAIGILKRDRYIQRFYRRNS